jgi:5-methylcytosine-specific restriction endonuclease McrA
MLKVIIGRKEAKVKGLKRYFTGKPCPKGHICDRMIVNTDCVQCLRLRTSLRYSNDPKYREKHKARMNYLYAENPQKFIDRAHVSYLENPQNARAHSANARARLLGISEVIKGNDILFVLKSQGYKCKYCAKSLHKEYATDHALALCRGGPNIVENIQCLCIRCHRNKTVADLSDYYKEKNKSA